MGKFSLMWNEIHDVYIFEFGLSNAQIFIFLHGEAQ